MIIAKSHQLVMMMKLPPGWLSYHCHKYSKNAQPIICITWHVKSLPYIVWKALYLHAYLIVQI